MKFKMITRPYLLVIFCCCLFTSISDASAQITFHWPDQEPDISKYSNVEQCLGIAHTMMISANDGVARQDTVQFNANDTINYLPESIVKEIQKCASKFSIDDFLSRDTLHPAEITDAYMLFLIADRYHDARRLSELWLNSLTSSASDSLIAFAHASLAQVALKHKPVRFDEAWSFINGIDIQHFWKLRMNAAIRAMRAAIRVHNIQKAEEAAAWLSETPSLLGREVTGQNDWQDPILGFGRIVLEAQKYLKRNEITDSLKRSTDAYFTFLQHLQELSSLDWPVSRKMSSPIEGHYWFPRKPSDARPRPGVVSVVLTTGINDCGNCLGRVMMIQRLQKQFPNVEFTILARTRGYYGMVIEPTAPAEEAELIDSAYRKLNQLPATLVVYETPFWKLQDPDRRRVNEAGPNEAMFPTLLSDKSEIIYLIDRKGEIVYKNSWANHMELQIGKVISALLEQPE